MHPQRWRWQRRAILPCRHSRYCCRATHR